MPNQLESQISEKVISISKRKKSLAKSKRHFNKNNSLINMVQLFRSATEMNHSEIHGIRKVTSSVHSTKN